MKRTSSSLERHFTVPAGLAPKACPSGSPLPRDPGGRRSGSMTGSATDDLPVCQRCVRSHSRSARSRPDATMNISSRSVFRSRQSLQETRLPCNKIEVSRFSPDYIRFGTRPTSWATSGRQAPTNRCVSLYRCSWYFQGVVDCDLLGDYVRFSIVLSYLHPVRPVAGSDILEHIDALNFLV